jgi:hypothetical protein
MIFAIFFILIHFVVSNNFLRSKLKKKAIFLDSSSTDRESMTGKERALKGLEICRGSNRRQTNSTFEYAEKEGASINGVIPNKILSLNLHLF